MPYRWRSETAPTATLELWPHRSLPKAGFVWFFGGTAGFVAVPLLAVLGTPVLWAILPFMAAAMAGLWWAIDHSYRTGRTVETLTLTRDTIALVQRLADGRSKEWSANPFWVQVRLHPTEGPVEEYLTLKGGDREVEIGAFLSPEERVALEAELRAALRRFR